jgi:sporulation protein YabP
VDGEKNNKEEYNHSLQLIGRRRLDLTGISKVYTFNENLVVLQTTMGILDIKGKDKKVNKLSVDSGDMSIEGELISLVYSSKNGGTRKKGSFVEKLFK